MPTQPINSTVQGYTYKQPRKTQEDVDFPLGSDQSKIRQEPDSKPEVTARGMIQAILNRIPTGDDNRLSFKDVVDHHDTVQSTWNSEVSDDLSNLGVAVSSPFRLMYDPAGAATVAGEHRDKEMINAYFTTNPSRVNELGESIRLGKLASGAQDRLSPNEMDQTLPPDAMAWWYVTNVDTSTLYSGGGLLFGAGGGVYKGVDIRV